MTQRKTIPFLLTRKQVEKIFRSRFNLFLQEAIDRDGKKEWTNRKIAEKLGLSENAVSTMRNNNNFVPAPHTLCNIAAMFGGTIGELLGRDPFRSPHQPPAEPTAASDPAREKRRARCMQE